MVRLIDADAYARDMHELNERLYRWYLLAKDEDVRQRANGAIALLEEVRFMLDEQPTVDAPVVHGHWIKIGSQYSIRNMKCSICGEEVFGDVDTEKYCFNCGAKMDEVTE